MVSSSLLYLFLPSSTLHRDNESMRPGRNGALGMASCSLVTECLATVPSQRPVATYILGFLVSGIPYPLNRDRLEHPLITTLLGSRDSDRGLFPGIDVPGGGEFFLSPDLLQYERPPATSETIIHQKLSTQTTPSSRKRRQSSSLEFIPQLRHHLVDKCMVPKEVRPTRRV